jgi:hypothetical protein
MAVRFTDGSNFDQVGSIAAPKDPLIGSLQNNGGSTFSESRREQPCKDAGDKFSIGRA